MPLQGILYQRGRAAHHARRQTTTSPGSRSVRSSAASTQVRPTRDVIFDMVEEWIETTERMSSMLGDDE